MSKKQLRISILLCLFIGVFGAHKFYNRQYNEGIAFLCTLAFAIMFLLLNVKILYFLLFGFLGLIWFLELIDLLNEAENGKLHTIEEEQHKKRKSLIRWFPAIFVLILYSSHDTYDDSSY